VRARRREHASDELEDRFLAYDSRYSLFFPSGKRYQTRVSAAFALFDLGNLFGVGIPI
jgi:hypothetical protein